MAQNQELKKEDTDFNSSPSGLNILMHKGDLGDNYNYNHEIILLQGLESCSVNLLQNCNAWHKAGLIFVRMF